MSRKGLSKLLALSFVCIFVCMSALTAFANEVNDEPIYRWTNVKKISWSNNVIGSQLKVSATITGYSGTTYSNGSIKVKNSSGTVIASTSGISSTLNSFTASITFTKPASGTYTATLTITATRGGVSETVTSSYTFTIRATVF